MQRSAILRVTLAAVAVGSAAVACGGTKGSGGNTAAGGGQNGTTAPLRTDYSGTPDAGNTGADGGCMVPAEAQIEDTSKPDHVVGTGTAASCTSAAVVAAVKQGGVITFDCGPDPITITLTETAKVFNKVGNTETKKVVIDGGGKVTLSGGNKVRILYQDTCDESLVWTTAQCQNQQYPELTVQNITFAEGNSTGQLEEGGGGGAILVRGGRLKVLNSRFFNNVCDPTGPDLGGAAVRTLSQYNNLPVYVVNSTFGGASGLGNSCSNGGGLSSIGVSYSVINSVFSYNSAIGYGANPATNGPGGGSGGAIYNDGNTYTLSLCGTLIEHNTAKEGGSAIFFVSNDKSGHLDITNSVLQNNTGDKFGTAGFPGIFVLSADGDKPVVQSSTIQ